jgi:hypothetical protein
MTVDQFRASLQQPAPPATLPPLLAALWWDAKGDWTRAHEIAQTENGAEAAWVHAYLHRNEGDDGNAGYWYGQARRPQCKVSFDAEWNQIVSALINSPL